MVPVKRFRHLSSSLFLIAIFGFLTISKSSIFAVGELTVIIDPGHGGTKITGTHLLKSNSSPNNDISPSGLREKDLTLEISQEIKKAFESDRCSNRIPKLLHGSSVLSHPENQSANQQFMEEHKKAESPFGNSALIDWFLGALRAPNLPN